MALLLFCVSGQKARNPENIRNMPVASQLLFNSRIVLIQFLPNVLYFCINKHMAEFRDYWLHFA